MIERHKQKFDEIVEKTKKRSLNIAKSNYYSYSDIKDKLVGLQERIDNSNNLFKQLVELAPNAPASQQDFLFAPQSDAAKGYQTQLMGTKIALFAKLISDENEYITQDVIKSLSAIEQEPSPLRFESMNKELDELVAPMASEVKNSYLRKVKTTRVTCGVLTVLYIIIFLIVFLCLKATGTDFGDDSISIPMALAFQGGIGILCFLIPLVTGGVRSKKITSYEKELKTYAQKSKDKSKEINAECNKQYYSKIPALRIESEKLSQNYYNQLAEDKHKIDPYVEKVNTFFPDSIDTLLVKDIYEILSSYEAPTFSEALRIAKDRRRQDEVNNQLLADSRQRTNAAEATRRSQEQAELYAKQQAFEARRQAEYAREQASYAADAARAANRQAAAVEQAQKDAERTNKQLVAEKKKQTAQIEDIKNKYGY